MQDLSRRRFLRHALAAGVAGGLAVSGRAELPQTAAPPRPNLVLIILDTLRPDMLGCYGCKRPTSPLLDKIASQGALFERVVAQCSWTRPSIGSFLTARYPRELGLYREENEILPGDAATLGKVLKEHGYATFGVTANPNLNKYFNFHLGFDTYLDSNVVFGWMPPEAGTEIRGRVSLPSAPWIYDRVLEFARTHADGPCYVQLNLMEIHEWYARDNYTLRRPEYIAMFPEPGTPFPKYLQSVRQLTDDTARFIERLAVLPGWENTLFVVVSDHGEGLGNHPSIPKSLYHGWLLYESQVLVPWIIFGTQWKPARARFDQPVRLLELMPTLLDFAGAPAPAGVQGVSLRPLLEGKADRADLPEYFMTETDYRGANKVGAYAAAWKFFDNQAPHMGLPPKELQARGMNECGARTDQTAQQPEIAAAMRAYTEAWAAQYAKVAPTAPAQALDAQQVEQLRAVGYLDDAG